MTGRTIAKRIVSIGHTMVNQTAVGIQTMTINATTAGKMQLRIRQKPMRLNHIRFFGCMTFGTHCVRLGQHLRVGHRVVAHTQARCVRIVAGIAAKMFTFLSMNALSIIGLNASHRTELANGIALVVTIGARRKALEPQQGSVRHGFVLFRVAVYTPKIAMTRLVKRRRVDEIFLRHSFRQHLLGILRVYHLVVLLPVAVEALHIVGARIATELRRSKLLRFFLIYKQYDCQCRSKYYAKYSVVNNLSFSHRQIVKVYCKYMINLGSLALVSASIDLQYL